MARQRACSSEGVATLVHILGDEPFGDTVTPRNSLINILINFGDFIIILNQFRSSFNKSLSYTNLNINI